MKRLISLFAVLACMAVSYAQSALVATLNHGENVSVYYGAGALAEAYNAATHGDVITLSSGTFASVDIAKNITIYGAGTDAAGPCTRIDGDFRLNGVAEDVDATGHLTLENLCHDGTIFLSQQEWGTPSVPVRNAHFVKCRLGSIYGSGGNDGLQNAVFLQCRVKRDIRLHQDNKSYVHCINSVINNPSTTYSTKDTRFEFSNCIITGNGSIDYSLFTNCILVSISSRVPSSCTVSNCLGIANPDYGNIFENIYPANKYGTISETDISTIFKTFAGTSNETGTYSDTETFELTDEAKAKYLGTDGTQVGIYGGSLPFTTESSLPAIKKFNVASKSTDDGKLKVEIEVSRGVE